MSTYTLTCNLLRGIQDQKYYISKILMHFIGDNPYKVSIDKDGHILSLYEILAKENHIIYTWVDLMGRFPPTNFEHINVSLKGIICEEELFLKVCKNTKNSQKLFTFSHQEWEKFEYIDENCISYDSTEIEIFDRDEAITELHPPKTGDVFNVKRSNFANRGGIIESSKID